MMGDINAPPRSRAYRRLTTMLRDTQTAPPQRGTQRAWATFPTRYPLLRLDYIFVGQSMEVLSTRTVRTPLARIASDHLPVVADLRIPTYIQAEPRQSAGSLRNET